MKYSGKQLEFESMYKTELYYIDYTGSFRWKQGFVFPICGIMRYWEKSKG